MLACAIPANGQAPKKVTFDDNVRPLLKRRCSVCHNSDRREGDLDVTSFVNLMQGGSSGTVLEPGEPGDSYLYELVTHASSPEMPPSGNKIPATEIKLLAEWIKDGLLENSGSKAAKSKPKVSLALKLSPTTRPEVSPTPFRISLEPVITPPVGSVLALASNPWAPVIAVSTPRQILLYHSDRLELAGVLPYETGIARSLSFSRNGELLLASGGRGGESGSVLMFNARTGQLIDQIGKEPDTILTADLSGDQSLIAIGSPNKRVAVMTSAGQPIHELKRHTDWVTAVCFSPDGQFLATADRNGTLLLWEADSGLFVQKLDGHTKAITSLQWRSDSQFFVTASEDGSVRVWDTEKAKPVKSWNAHGSGCLVAGFRRDGSIYSAGRDHLVKLWQANGKAIRTFKGLQDIVVAATVCDETNRVFAADWNGKLLAWNLDNGKVLKTLPANPPTLKQQLSQAKTELQQTQAKVNGAGRSSTNMQAQVLNAENQRTAIHDQIKKGTRELQGRAGSKNKLHANRQGYRLANLRRTRDLPAHQAKLKQLKAALPQAKLALESLPDEPRLVEAVAFLESEIQAIQRRNQRFTQLALANFREHLRIADDLRNLVQQTNQLNATQNAKKNQTNQIQKRIQDLNGMIQQQSKIKATAEQELAAKQKAVERWQNAIQFEQDLTRLKTQLVDAESQLAVKRETIQQAQQQHKLAEEKVKQAEQASQASRAAVEAVQKQLQQLQLQ